MEYEVINSETFEPISEETVCDTKEEPRQTVSRISRLYCFYVCPKKKGYEKLCPCSYGLAWR